MALRPTRQAGGGTSFLWSSRGTATRRQWWLGHLAALALTVSAFVGLSAFLVGSAVYFELDPGSIGFAVLSIAIALVCVTPFVLASNALSRRRLNDKGQSHWIIDAFLGLTVVEVVVSMNDAVLRVAARQWPLPITPDWLEWIVTGVSALTLALTVLECGAFRRWSLIALWRSASPTGRHGSAARA